MGMKFNSKSLDLSSVQGKPQTLDICLLGLRESRHMTVGLRVCLGFRV